MSELTRGQVNDLIAGFAVKDGEYRAALMRNPKKVLALQLNQELPDALKVVVVKDTADTLHLVMPYVPKEGEHLVMPYVPKEGEELSDADLETVAGGKGKGGGGPSSVTCNDAKGGFMTYIQIEASLVG
ncbi:MAG: NHLP leader peptide family RiPP precursor [Acidobacteriia bacterium]|nr:NHLP leader peptide family RiPP precursor [Terriglobia bacterium]